MPAMMTRSILVMLLVGTVAVSAACWLKIEEVDFSFENLTDAPLCVYTSHEDAAASRCVSEVKPADDRKLTVGCGDGPGVEDAPITVVLTVKEGARQIYQRTEECQVWQGSERTFVIEQRGDEFVVTDPLTDATPSP